MVVETLCHTDVSIPTRVLEKICAQFPGVPPDAAMRKVAMAVSNHFSPESSECPGADDGLEPGPDWPYESQIVRIVLPVSALNRLKLITQVANHQYAIIAAVLDFLDDPARIGRRVR
ncbi:hypothetical protein MARGE09_P3421 [Marinagarivorans cellulosilyticus]|uniref:Uncharacterized protein n=1 Tax=Marinagarivorans cellulosilyticus TaxID=2721545 RepID=A0AAN1WKE3_9GAMM|nr:hypothetical protein MARGE09_P3421 [Marinagarivorans cellulosilyticus]